MNITIRKMQSNDSEAVINMMRKFYNSSAVITSGSEKIFAANVENCLRGIIDGFVFVDGDKIIGYGITARGYSTEFGGACIWIEDIFIEEDYRGRGVGTKFIHYVKELYPEKILRLEVEGSGALNFYKNLGFKELPYMEMIYNGK